MDDKERNINRNETISLDILNKIVSIYFNKI